MSLLAAATISMMTWHVIAPRPAEPETPPDDLVAYLLAPEHREGLKASAALLVTLAVAYALLVVIS